VADPIVSVIVATYNRSNVLRYAIETVRWQSLTNWELLIVGDVCTDDTADVVAAFNDPRIRFWNLTEPCGEQSGPNNAGMAEARGRYVAMLNHDDLWAPRHLAAAVAALDADPRLDLVYGLNVIVYPDRLLVTGPSPTGAFEEHAHLPASAWVFRRALQARIRPWRPARDLHIAPSQDWLHRARRSGARMRLLPHLSVVSIPSGRRPRSYADRPDAEHVAWFARMTATPDWEQALLSELVCQLDLTSYESSSSLRVIPFLKRAGRNVVRRLLIGVGLHPATVATWLYYRRRGGLLDEYRRVRGLGPLPRPQADAQEDRLQKKNEVS
jgi:glycosyltransferase involved in cell wall biosynthesis